MKVGMHNWMRPEPLDVTLARLQKLGYDGIEIMGEPRKYDVKDTLKLLKKYKIECYGSVTIMIKGRDLIHSDVYYREMSLQYVKECIDLVANLGGTLLTLVPSEVGKVVAMSDQDTEWKWAVEGIRKAADHAAKKKVKIGLEPLNRFETNFLNNHKQALKLAGDVGDDVGVCLDAFHINIEEEDPYEAVTVTAKAGKLVDFHVADNNRFPPGGGNWDWKKLISTLRKAGYDGWITSEFVVPMDRSPLAKKAEAAGTTATEAELKFIRDHGSDLMSDAAYSKYVEDTIKTLKKAGV